MSIRRKTVSIWTDILINKNLFLNKNYSEKKSKAFILTPSYGMFKMKFWEEHFLKFNSEYVMKSKIFTVDITNPFNTIKLNK